MKQLLLSLLFLCCAFMNAQKDFGIKIFGNVISSWDNTPIPNCALNLKIDQGMIVKIRTDAAGKYEFNLTNPNFIHAVVYVTTDENTVTKTAHCGFLASDEQAEVHIGKDSISEYQRDFALYPIHHCDSWNPRFYFKKNSVDFDTIYRSVTKYMDSSDYVPEVALDKFAVMMKKNSSMIIQFDCHCSSEEKGADRLSLLRAEKIKLELMNLGIEGTRIEIKGWGERKLMISDATIKKSNTKEKEGLHQQNRRCVWEIVSWDYKEKK